MSRWIVAAYVCVLVGMSVFGPPFGHDEAVYALGADAALGGDSTPLQLHRPVGMIAIAAPGVLAGGGELGFRLTALVGTLGLLAAAWLFAARATDRRTAAWTVAVVGTSYAIVRRGTEMLPDPWAAALILCVATLVVGRLGREEAGARWDLVWLGPLAAAAFYVRYGSLAVTAGVGLAALVVYRRALARSAWPLGAAAVLAALLAIPHVAHSLATTDSPLGVLRASQRMAGRSYTGDGLVFYATRWWIWLGPVAAVCVAAGAVSAARRSSSTAVFAGLASLLVLVAIGISAHGEARYALVPQVLLTTIGVDAIRRAVRPRPRAAAALVAATLVTSVVLWSRSSARSTDGVTVSAGRAVQRAAGGQRCEVLASKWAQVEWYSGCRGVAIAEVAITPDRLARTPAVFAVWFDRGPRQPREVIDDLLAARHGVRARVVERIEHAGAWGGATIYQLVAAASPE